MQRFTPICENSRDGLRIAIYSGGGPEGIISKAQHSSGDGKKDECAQERMFGLSEFVEMDFVEYGDYAEFLHIRDTFSRFSVAVFIGTEKRADIQRKWSAGR